MSEPGSRSNLVGHPNDPKKAPVLNVPSDAYGDPQTTSKIVSVLCDAFGFVFPPAKQTIPNFISHVRLTLQEGYRAEEAATWLVIDAFNEAFGLTLTRNATLQNAIAAVQSRFAEARYNAKGDEAGAHLQGFRDALKTFCNEFALPPSESINDVIDGIKQRMPRFTEVKPVPRTDSNLGPEIDALVMQHFDTLARIAPPSGFEILRECLTLAEFLYGKNKAYGDSALKPVRVMSTCSDAEQIRVRMDDKLSRMIKGQAAGEDVVQDFVGYWILLKIMERSQKPGWRVSKIEMSYSDEAVALAGAVPGPEHVTENGLG